LFEELAGNEDPLSPDNILVFATGPFQGTGIPGAGRHLVMSVSPKTKAVAGSYVGGYFGHELGRSGYDGVLFRGVATTPVVVALVNGTVQFKDATKLWGKGTGETEDLLREEFQGGRVASIGIAGENLVQMACIIHDRSRASGRPGLGAVMGSKRLKAVVVKGNYAKRLSDSNRFAKARSEYTKTLLDSSFDRLRTYGTAQLVKPLSELGVLPTKNFQQGVFAHADAISGERIHESILVGRETCAGCPIRCKRSVQTFFDGRPVEPEYGGPEYETVAAFGSLCLNDNLPAIALANQLCNNYGIDTISAGVAAAFVMEATEKGFLRPGLAWGDAKGLITLIDSIAHRMALGDQIADGLESFARTLEAPFCMTIKGVEIPMHEPRGKQGLAISYATSPRGATHMEGMHDTILEACDIAPELGITDPYDRFSLSDKPAVAKTFEDLRSFENSLILCIFTSRSVGKNYRYPLIRSLLESVTGFELSPSEMLEVGERNYAMLKLHAVRSGYTAKNDALPSRFHSPLYEGASAHQPIDAHILQEALATYYHERGYSELGPTEATLRRLRLDEYIGAIGTDT